MFTDRYFGKKRAKRAAESTDTGAAVAGPQAASPARAEDPSPDLTSAASVHPRAGAAAASAGSSRPLEGLALEDFARMAELTETEVWRRLRRGELVGRTRRGRLTIYSSTAAATAADANVSDLHEVLAEAAPPADSASSVFSDALGRHLPPLPSMSGVSAAFAGQHTTEGRPFSGASAHGPGSSGHFLALSGNQTHSPEMALLLDHLSLAKEENREILRLTQDSIRKVTELTGCIVEMKDQVIEAKDTQIGSLKERLDDRERQIRKLLQQKEDLEMLARTMADVSK